MDTQRYRCTPYTVKTTATSFYISSTSDEDAIIQAKEKASKETKHCDRVIVTNDRNIGYFDVSIV